MTGGFGDLIRLPVQMTVGGHLARFVSWGHIPPQPWRNYPHVHSFYEVCYAYSGQGSFTSRNVHHRVQAGELFLARPGDVHEICADDGGDLGLYYWGFTLVPVHGAAAKTTDDSASSLVAAFAAAQTAPTVQPADASLLHVVAALNAEAATPIAGIATVSALASALVLTTMRSIIATEHTKPPALATRDDAVVATIERYLRDNAAREVRLRDIAAQVHLSERHTSRLFTRRMGVPIRTYLHNVRHELARQLLLDPNRSVTAVAHACGYPDAHHFAAAFRIDNGQTPTEFRNRGGTALVK